MPKWDDLSLLQWDGKVSFIRHHWKELLILSKDSSGSPVWKKIGNERNQVAHLKSTPFQHFINKLNCM